MGSVRKREGPNGVRWQARWRGPDGEERARTFHRRRDADAFLNTIAVDIDRGAYVDPRAGRITFREWALQWLATTAGNRETTRARDLSILRAHLIPAWGPLPLADIDHMRVRGFIAALDRKPATVVKVYHVASKILGAAVDAKVLPHNPCERVPLPRIEDHEARFLTADELHTLADAAGSWRPAILLMGYGGLRIGEVAGLRRRNVDLLRGTVRVAETAVEVSGRLGYQPPKTRAGRRTVPLPRFVVDEFAGVARATQNSGETLVFAGREGGGMRPNTWRRRVFAPAVEAAGLEPLTPHELRHTAIALWISAGVDSKRVAAWAGHTSVRSILDRYGHLYEVDDAAFTDRLDAVARQADRSGDVRRLGS